MWKSKKLITLEHSDFLRGVAEQTITVKCDVLALEKLTLLPMGKRKWAFYENKILFYAGSIMLVRSAVTMQKWWILYFLLIYPVLEFLYQEELNAAKGEALRRAFANPTWYQVAVRMNGIRVYEG
jgi:hypothetical protein